MWRDSGQRVVALVAVHVHQQAALGRQLAQQPHAGCALFTGPLEVQDAADHVHAQVEREFQVVHAAFGAQHAVLRKGDQLQVDIGRDAAFDFEQGFDRQQAGVAGIDMAADRQQAPGDGPVAVGEGALDDGVGPQEGFEFAPHGDAFEQRAAFVDARQAVAQRGVHVEMGIDERRAQQVALRVDDFMRRGVQAGRDLGDAAVLHGH